jgi:hypothetical protein
MDGEQSHLTAPSNNEMKPRWGMRRERGRIRRLMLSLSPLATCVAACVPSPPNDAPNWHVEQQAQPTATHPLAGFWKSDGCKDDFGLAIGPMGEQTYYVSFCGPGGCFAEATYRPETTIHGDSSYKVVDADTIDVVGFAGTTTRYVRCRGRVDAQ